jgi:hypothetical protein
MEAAETPNEEIRANVEIQAVALETPKDVQMADEAKALEERPTADEGSSVDENSAVRTADEFSFQEGSAFSKVALSAGSIAAAGLSIKIPHDIPGKAAATDSTVVLSPTPEAAPIVTETNEAGNNLASLQQQESPLIEQMTDSLTVTQAPAGTSRGGSVDSSGHGEGGKGYDDGRKAADATAAEEAAAAQVANAKAAGVADPKTTANTPMDPKEAGAVKEVLDAEKKEEPSSDEPAETAAKVLAERKRKLNDIALAKTKDEVLCPYPDLIPYAFRAPGHRRRAAATSHRTCTRTAIVACLHFPISTPLLSGTYAAREIAAAQCRHRRDTAKQGREDDRTSCESTTKRPPRRAQRKGQSAFAQPHSSLLSPPCVPFKFIAIISSLTLPYRTAHHGMTLSPRCTGRGSSL